MRQMQATFWLTAQRLTAGLALVGLAPLFAILWVAVRATSKGPFLFKQDRPGLGGRTFTIFKIRTMSCGAERRTALGVQAGSPEITRVGRILRNLKLDELPQLINIVRGDMELVGPRPLPAALDAELTRKIPGFERRYQVRPGLTNVSQIAVLDNGLGDRLSTDWRFRHLGELHYIRNKSIAYDLVAIAMTALYILRKALPRKGALEQAVQEGPLTSTEVAGVRIANVTYNGVISKMAEWIDEQSRRYICICPVHSIVEATRDPRHRNALQQAALNTADGVPVVWAQRLFGHRKAERVYGPTLMLHTLERAEQEGWRVALYGGHEDRLDVLVERLTRQFPALQIVAAISPPFRELSAEEDQEIVDTLNAAKPDIVWVGLGCPKQERWMLDHSWRLRGVLVGVGAAFDFHAGAVTQAPAFLQRIGMEWFFRLCCEPRRLFARYASTNPAYIGLVMRQSLRLLGGRKRFQHRETVASPTTSRQVA